MIKKFLAGGILGGLIIFIWSAASWMLLPWHHNIFNGFTQETEVKKVVVDHATKSGVYTLPGMSSQTSETETVKGPFVFAVVHLEDSPGMGQLLLTELIIQIIAAFLITIVMLNIRANYLTRVSTIALFALAAGISTCLPLWNWFGFPMMYTIIAMADLFIAWLLAAFVIAWVTND